MHKILKTAGLAIATLTVAVISSAPSFAGGLYDPPGSLKDGSMARNYRAAGPGDVGYSGTSDGDIKSGQVASASLVNPPVRLGDMTAHEFKIGLRYHFSSTGPSYK